MQAALRRAASAAGSLACAAGLWWASSAADLAQRPALDPASARALWDAALSARGEGRLDDSLGSVRRLLASYPGDPRYLGFQAEILELTRRPLDAARSWELYLPVAPFPTEACPSLGRDYAKAGRDADGLDADRRCLALDPSKSDLMLFYALSLERAGHDAQAEGMLLDVLKRSPQNSDALAARTRLALKKGDIAGAEQLAAAAFAAGPENPDVLLSLALVAQAKGDLAAARRNLETAIHFAPGYSDLYRVLARVQEKAGDDDGARKARSQATDVDAWSAR